MCTRRSTINALVEPLGIDGRSTHTEAVVCNLFRYDKTGIMLVRGLGAGGDGRRYMRGPAVGNLQYDGYCELRLIYPCYQFSWHDIVRKGFGWYGAVMPATISCRGWRCLVERASCLHKRALVHFFVSPYPRLSLLNNKSPQIQERRIPLNCMSCDVHVEIQHGCDRLKNYRLQFEV